MAGVNSRPAGALRHAAGPVRGWRRGRSICVGLEACAAYGVQEGSEPRLLCAHVRRGEREVEERAWLGLGLGLGLGFGFGLGLE